MAKGDSNSDLSFLVQCTGQIESGDFGPHDNLYCRYSMHYGSDWGIVSVISHTMTHYYLFIHSFISIL